VALSVNPLTYVISIPKSDLTLVEGTLYSMDTDAFRLELKAWEDDADGMVQPKTHNHNTEVVIVGTAYYRTIEIIPPYSVTFEDGQYSVILQGSNNNIWDIQNGVLNQNQVQVIPTNSAGGQIVTISTGSGLSAEENTKLMGLPEETEIAQEVWNEEFKVNIDFVVPDIVSKEIVPSMAAVICILTENEGESISESDISDLGSLFIRIFNSSGLDYTGSSDGLWFEGAVMFPLPVDLPTLSPGDSLYFVTNMEVTKYEKTVPVRGIKTISVSSNPNDVWGYDRDA